MSALNEFSPIWVVPMGIVAGLLVTSMVARWFIALYCAKTGKPIPARSRGVTPASAAGATAILPVVFLHSGFWVVLLLVASTIVVLTHSHATWWNWFFGALYLTPLLLVAAMKIMAARTKRRRGL